VKHYEKVRTEWGSYREYCLCTQRQIYSVKVLLWLWSKFCGEISFYKEARDLFWRRLKLVSNQQVFCR